VSQLRRISKVLAKSGAAIAVIGATAGCAVAQTHAAPAAAAKPLAVVSSPAAILPNFKAPSHTSPSRTHPATKPKPPVTVTTTPSNTAPSTRAAAPAPVQQAAAKRWHGDPCSATAAACVSLAKQEAWFVSDGRVARGPVSVATGRPGYETEIGTFWVYRKNLMWYSTIYNNAPMPYSVFFDGGEAFHEGSVYVPSHGCVHLSSYNAPWVYNFLHIGDEVQVVY
jgi:lipoprotein-anchoring transpeptidase ErfK/SrfK